LLRGREGRWFVAKKSRRFRNAKSKLAFFKEIIFTKLRLFLCVGLKFYGL